MPEPNLPPLRLYEDISDLKDSVPNQVNIARIKANLVELPETVRQNLVKSFKLRIETAHMIVVKILFYNLSTRTWIHLVLHFHI